MQLALLIDEEEITAKIVSTPQVGSLDLDSLQSEHAREWYEHVLGKLTEQEQIAKVIEAAEVHHSIKDRLAVKITDEEIAMGLLLGYSTRKNGERYRAPETEVEYLYEPPTTVTHPPAALSPFARDKLELLVKNPENINRLLYSEAVRSDEVLVRLSPQVTDPEAADRTLRLKGENWCPYNQVMLAQVISRSYVRSVNLLLSGISLCEEAKNLLRAAKPK
ncbi:hypothetical protein HY988_01840 [Candidatus Micrarchaeota archaeon]|nr:hypothetical protein [Candidatus Micrarchaeota archaeon]